MQYSLQLKEVLGLLTTKKDRKAFCRAANCGSSGKLQLTPGQVRQGLSALGYSYEFRRLAFINLKGGVGKTTTAVTLATRAVQFGYKVCLLDLDSQASASLALGVVAGEETPVFHDIWQKPGQMTLGSLHRLQEHFYLLPSSLQNGLLESGLQNPAALKTAVDGVCRILEEEGFDLVLLDCPPSLGAAVISSICAAQGIVIPLGCDVFSQRGMELTLKETRAIRETFGLPLPPIHLLLTGVDRRISLWEKVQTGLKQTYGGMLLPFVIRTSSAYARALAKQQTIFASQANTPARQDQDQLARLLLGFNGFKPKSS
jgi:chromosome partitioning protein